MNVLLFNLRLDADDGVLGFTTDWVNAIAQRCDQVFIITMHAGAMRVAPNVTVLSVGLELGHGKARRLLTFYRQLIEVLGAHQIDVCFAHMNYLFALLASPILRARGIPILLWYAHKATSLTLKAAEKVVDAVVTSSPTGFQIPSRKVSIIGQGIDTERFSPAIQTSSASLRLLSFGRISRIKRLEVIIDAMAALRASRPQMSFECKIVGDPLSDDCRKYLLELKNRARSRDVEKEVRFCPGVPFHQAQAEFQQADIFLNPGDTDSVDKTGLEAMSCGVPIITSNIAFKHVLPDDMHAFSVVAKDDVDALTNAVARMESWTEAERQTYGLKGRQIVVAEHSIDHLANKLIAAMETLVSKRKGFGDSQRQSVPSQ